MIILIGTLFTIVFTFVVGLFCGAVEWFIDIPSFLVVVLPLVFYLYITKSGKIIGDYINSSFKKNHKYNLTELDIIASSVKNTVKFILATGYFSFFSGLIATLVRLNEPSEIGPSFAISLITIYYAIALSYFIFFPLQAWAENKIKQISINEKQI